MNESRSPLGQEVDSLEYRFAAAYQVIGCFLDHLGVHDSEKGQRLLDFFAGFDAPDPLPFSIADLLLQAQRQRRKRLLHPPTQNGRIVMIKNHSLRSFEERRQS